MRTGDRLNFAGKTQSASSSARPAGQGVSAMKPKTSAMWEHCKEKVDAAHLVVCNHCSMDIKRGKAGSSRASWTLKTFKYHLEKKHPDGSPVFTLSDSGVQKLKYPRDRHSREESFTPRVLHWTEFEDPGEDDRWLEEFVV